jgi:curli biogenesis system outer membrane secretion channel CsgG
MKWLKANWKMIMWALIAIAALILLWIIFHPAPTPNDHSHEKKTIDSLISVIQVLKKKTNEINSHDSAKISTAKRKTDSLQTIASTWYAKAKTFEANGKYYSLLYEDAKKANNAGSGFVACDEIIAIVDSQSRVINTFKTLSDSIDVQTNIQLNLKDSIIQTTQALLTFTDNALTTTNKAYQGLSKDYAKQVKANKTNRTLARGLAAVVLILGTILVLK